jgi:DNA-binding XRE family transcriptional regulator
MNDNFSPHLLSPEQVAPLVGPSTLPPPRERATLVADPELLPAILNHLLRRSGLSQAEIARRLGEARQSVQQYHSGVRPNPSLKWFLRYAQVCGAKVVVEFPDPY